VWSIRITRKSQHRVLLSYSLTVLLSYCPKRKEQEYFRGVFEEASKFENENEDDIGVGSSLKPLGAKIRDNEVLLLSIIVSNCILLFSYEGGEN
jgi:hypothetical protein